MRVREYILAINAVWKLFKMHVLDLRYSCKLLELIITCDKRKMGLCPISYTFYERVLAVFFLFSGKSAIKICSVHFFGDSVDNLARLLHNLLLAAIIDGYYFK